MLQLIKDIGNQIKALASLLLLIISGILASVLYFEEKKNASNEELLKNDKINDEVNKLDQQVVLDQSNITSEANKRQLLEDTEKKEINENTNDQDIANSISNRE